MTPPPPGRRGGARGGGPPKRRGAPAARADRSDRSDRTDRADRADRAGHRDGGRDRKPADRGLGGDQIEGRRAVRELLAAGRRRVKDLWMAEGLDEAPVLAEILDLAAEARVTVRSVARARIDGVARTEAPQGVIAFAEPVAEVDLEVLARRRSGGAPPFILAVDGVTDPHNLGALLRSADVAGATGVVLPKHRTVHLTPTVAKAAAGAIEHLSFALVPGLPAALATLKGLGVWTVGLDAGGTDSIYDLTVATEPLALVVGAEGTGLSRLTAQRCDLRVTIPQHGHLESLNVSAAGAVALFEVARRRSG